MVDVDSYEYLLEKAKDCFVDLDMYEDDPQALEKKLSIMPSRLSQITFLLFLHYRCKMAVKDRFFPLEEFLKFL